MEQLRPPAPDTHLLLRHPFPFHSQRPAPPLPQPHPSLPPPSPDAGVAVMAVMITTTFVLLLTALVYWQVSLLLIIPVFLFYGLVEGLFFAAVLFKVRGLYCCW